MSGLVMRKTFAQIEEIRSVAGEGDEGGPLRKVAVCAVVRNPFAGQGYVADLSPIVEASDEIGTYLGEEAVRLLGSAPESYGKGGLVGTAGEQEHINAAVTSTFGNALRKAIGGGEAWITSVTKISGTDATIDVALAENLIRPGGSLVCGVCGVSGPGARIGPLARLVTASA
ncbi:amino acid synthesis family protein [Streptomyces sp. NPDC055681]